MLSSLYTQTKAQKLQRMLGNKHVQVEQRKTGRESRTGGKCNKLLNTHSLPMETCVGQFPTPFRFREIFNIVQITKLYSYQEEESFL